MVTPPNPIIGIIFGRMDSERLPGKMLLRANGVPLIGYVIERAKRIMGVQSIVLATTGRPTDDELAEYARTQGIEVFRGDSEKVLYRGLKCAQQYGAIYFVRLNGDSPFLDYHLIGQSLGCLQLAQPDLVSNLIGRTFPYGISVEIIRTETLRRLLMTEQLDYQDQEHVTRYFYRNRWKFSIHRISSRYPELSGARLTVDTEDDFTAFCQIISELGDDALSSEYGRVARLRLSMNQR
jgi:spore coat polysaccharide biosynthesis protein SpsF